MRTTHNTSSGGNGIYSVIAAVSIVALIPCQALLDNDQHGSERGVSSTAPPVIELSCRYLWDPNAPNLEDWQAIGLGPMDITWGGQNNIFLSDAQNSRVINFTKEGTLIYVIGRQGEGPGEFQQPLDLAYDTSNDILWVVERIQGRVSRFQIQENEFEFIDRTIFPAFIAHRWPCLVHEDGDLFWINWISRFVDNERHGKKTRIQLMDLKGNEILGFGERWTPRHAEMSEISWNRGFLEKLPNSIAFISQHRPVVEVWSKNGELLSCRENDYPGLNVRPPHRISRDEIHIFPTFISSASHPSKNILYVLYYHSNKELLVILALDPSTLEILQEFHMIPEDNGIDHAFIQEFLVDDTGGNLSFYGLDLTQSSIVHMEVKNPL